MEVYGDLEISLLSNKPRFSCFEESEIGIPLTLQHIIIIPKETSSPNLIVVVILIGLWCSFAVELWTRSPLGILVVYIAKGEIDPAVLKHLYRSLPSTRLEEFQTERDDIHLSTRDILAPSSATIS